MGQLFVDDVSELIKDMDRRGLRREAIYNLACILQRQLAVYPDISEHSEGLDAIMRGVTKTLDTSGIGKNDPQYIMREVVSGNAKLAESLELVPFD